MGCQLEWLLSWNCLGELELMQLEEMQCFQMPSTLDPRYKLDWCIGDKDSDIKDH